ncbi:MAG: bifunctional phosphopantothenoylcysteine decarboxylase/phosphopantothenate--cysteine ligase CoaBC [marine benthic group bacterium]|nr:bifunctional phosphopantothenoylcysteine decarboxylase/phosphopantothenate--cysteine ligase CoaBC [Gemmatimonadota bacterium]
MRPFDGRRVLLVVAGGIAAYKSVHLLRSLRSEGAEVEVMMTGAAEHFVGRVTFEALAGRPVHTDLWTRPLAHIELGREGDLAIVAPATADLLAAMAHGRADDLASATLLAADCPVLACPAMNTRMWEHPATVRNLEMLTEDGVRLVGPEDGPLAEGEFGVGRMAEPEQIMSVAGRLLEVDSILGGRKVVVTAGPTREAIDPVRFLGNRSSGRMGFELAASAWRRGAEVVCIHGPATVPRPHGPKMIETEDADAMLRSLRTELDGAAVLCMAAAVSDFRAASPSREKIKKEDVDAEGFRLELERGPDLLVETKEQRESSNIFTLGFALETRDGLRNARSKLEGKGMDLVALNIAGSPGSGFDVDTNRITVLDPAGTVEELPLLTKREAADRLLDRIEDQLGDGS